MANQSALRKSQFKAALALAGITATAWAKEQGVTLGHLSMVLNGRESKRLTDEIDAFIKNCSGLKRTRVA